jgi:hypothetical protein
MAMKKYKYITIKETPGGVYDKHPIYKIINNKSGDRLGRISYYPRWKQFIAEFSPYAVFNNTCLRDIIDFMENEIK